MKYASEGNNKMVKGLDTVQMWAAKGALRGFDGHEQSAGLGKFTFCPVEIGRYAHLL